MNKTCAIIVGFLLLIIAAGGYKFILQGEVVEGADGRVAILLTDSERNLVLEEMRAFLTSVQKISEGVSKDDMQLVAEYARKAGAAAQQQVPGTLMGKLPLSFKQLGFDTHSKFDLLAMDAESLGDGEHALGQLSELMNNCVACHATYRLELAKE